MTGEIVLEAVGHHLGLGENAGGRRQMAAEQGLDEGEMCAAEDGAVGRRPFRLGEGRLDARHDERLEVGFGGALLDGPGQLRAHLLHDRDARAALADLLGIDVGGDRARRAEHGDAVGQELLRILRRGDGPGRLGCGLDGGGDDAHHVVALGAPAGARQPGRLQAAGGHGRRRVAAEDDELAALREQRLDAGAGEIDDLLRRAVAVGDVGVVAQVDEREVRKALGQRGQHRETAKPRIEDANHARP